MTKVVCINAPIQRYSGYRDFHYKEKKYSYDRCCNTVYFKTPFLIIYFSAIEHLFVIEYLSLKGFTSFGFAQNKLHDFRNTVLNS